MSVLVSLRANQLVLDISRYCQSAGQPILLYHFVSFDAVWFSLVWVLGIPVEGQRSNPFQRLAQCCLGFQLESFTHAKLTMRIQGEVN